MCSIGTIIATILAASVSHANGDLLLDTQVNAFNATVVDDRGNSMRVRGKILNVQLVYVYPSGYGPVKYDNVDWSVKAQSTNGEDAAVYSFSLSDDSAESSATTQTSELEQFLEDISPLMPVMVPDDSTQSSFSSFSPQGQQTTSQVGATTTSRLAAGDTGAKFPAAPNSRPGNSAFAQSSQNAAVYSEGSTRVKRNAQSDAPNGNGEHQHHVPTTAANSTANITDNVGTNLTMSNYAANETAMSNMQMSHNVSATINNGTMTNETVAGSGGRIIIPSWMAILVPLFAIGCTLVE